MQFVFVADGSVWEEVGWVWGCDGAVGAVVGVEEKAWRRVSTRPTLVGDGGADYYYYGFVYAGFRDQDGFVLIDVDVDSYVGG